MRHKFYILLTLSGFMLLAGLAGSEDVAAQLGEAGRTIGELIFTSISGIALMAAGIAGLNKGGIKR